MQSDRRLHPLSFLFGLGTQVRRLLLPGLLVLVTTRGFSSWQVWVMLLFVPAAVASLVQTLFLRYRYDDDEMVIRRGLLFRSERHVPYERIHNIDSVQNVVHRLFKVAEVRVQTGGGTEPEATLRVLPLAALEDMRRRVFENRRPKPEPATAAESGAQAPERSGPVVRLSPGEIALAGFLDSRGMVIIGALFGLAWEIGVLDAASGRIFGENASGRGIVREIFRALLGFGQPSLAKVALTIAAFVAFLVLVRILSMAWALVRLYGFVVTRAGDDLRSEYGLLTRVSATVPLRRIQTLTIFAGPFHRLFRRVSVRVSTAGSESGEGGTAAREWLAPILPQERLPELLGEVLPDARFAEVRWQRVHPRAAVRVAKLSIVLSVFIPTVVSLSAGWWVLVAIAVLVPWSFVHAWFYAKHLGYAVTEGAVHFRSGWIWRHVTIARFAKIQVVSIAESPFDRRAGMASVRVDTAGAGSASHHVHIPYLGRPVARGLYDVLATQAARTAFRW